MRARDAEARTIVRVEQARIQGQLGPVWVVAGFRLDDGSFLALDAIETDAGPAVTAKVLRRRSRLRRKHGPEPRP